MLERRLLMLLEVEAEPAGGEAAVAIRLFACDQCRELERLGDRHPADLSRRHLREHEVVVFQRPTEDRSRMALRGRRYSSPGPRRLLKPNPMTRNPMFRTVQAGGRLNGSLATANETFATKSRNPDIRRLASIAGRHK